MAQSFQEFLEYLKKSTLPDQAQSQEELFEITNALCTSPDLYQYILQIYDSNNPEITKFIPLLPPIFEKFQVHFYKHNIDTKNEKNSVAFLTTKFFFKFLGDKYPDSLEQLTKMIVENNNVDLWFCNYIWSPFYSVVQNDQYIIQLFEVMKQIFEASSENYTNNKLLQKGFMIYNVISSQRYNETINSVQFYEYSAELFLNYFTPQNIENESLSQLTGNFITEMVNDIKCNFDFYFIADKSRCLIQFFKFIEYIAKFENGNQLINIKVTELFYTIIREVNGLLNWILFINPDKFTESRMQFIENFIPTLLQNSVDTALIIENSFPCDTCMLISHTVLCCIDNILKFYANKTSDYEAVMSQYAEQLLQLVFIYSALPEEIQNQFIINPAIYYNSAYCKNILSESEPRSFSYKYILKLFVFNPQLTLQFLFQLPLNFGTMYLMGIISQNIINIQSKDDKEKYILLKSVLTEDVLDQFSKKIQELLSSCEFEPDSLFLKSNSLLFLSDEQCQELISISFDLLHSSDSFNSDNFSSDKQFNFTLASKIVYSLLAFFKNQSVYDALTKHITIISEYSSFCLTDDAINAVSYYFMQNADIFKQNAPTLFDLYLSTIMKLSNDFKDDYQILEKNDLKIVNQSFYYINYILKIKDAPINEQNFAEFLCKLFNGFEQNLTEDISNMMINVARYLPNGYIDYINLFFEFCQKVEIISFSDYFTTPFISFIYYNQEIFMDWQYRNEFIEFSIQLFIDNLEQSMDSDEFYDVYYLSSLVCMFILTPDLLDESILTTITQNCIDSISNNEDGVLKYACFNIIVSVIHISKLKMPDEVIQSLLDFMSKGYASRKSERKRYIDAIVSTKQLYSEEIVENINKIVEMINLNQIENAENGDVYISADNVGINAEQPYGY